METKKIFEKYRARMIRNGILKALICGLIAGFVANFIVAFVTWVTPIPGLGEEGHTALWFVLILSIGIGLGVFLLSTVIFYFIFFRPNTQSIARAVDRLGLEERAITMYELENDDSYIAMRQREDAKMHLGSFSAKALTVMLPTLAVVLLCVFGVLGAGMTTFSAIASERTDLRASSIIESWTQEDEEFVEVSYMVWMGGYIEGNPIQIIKKGTNTEPVLAVADDGWVFLQWAEDGYASMERMDYRVQGEDEDGNGIYTFVRTAYFVPIQESDNENENPNDNNQEQDQPDDQPRDSKDDQWQAPALDGEGDGNDTNSSDNPPTGALPSPDNDFIVDGKTSFTDDRYWDYDKKMEELQGNEDLPPELKDILGGYYGSW